MPDQPRSPHQEWAGEVDRLLRKLDGDAPRRRPGAASPAAPRTGGNGAARRAAHAAGSAAAAGVRRFVAGRRPSASPPAAVLTLPSVYGVWARVGLAVILATAMTQWPYRACGAALAAYFLGALAVGVAGGWAAHASWRRRMGWAHVVAVATLFAGVAMAALQVLQRFGYAPVPTPWGCGL